MKFNPPLSMGYLIKRYKRFLADIELPDGSTTTIHCPNTGSMKECLQEGATLWFSHSDNPKRKYPCTWEIATTPRGDLAGINTGRANGLVREAVEQGLIGELQGYDSVRSEVRYGSENSRIDLLLEGVNQRRCYVEIKNVTLCDEGGRGRFPDAVSSRGAKHLRELAQVARDGDRAMLFYCVQHTGIVRVSPAWEIDPEYCSTLQQAMDEGVEVVAYQATLNANEIKLAASVPFDLDL